jgi:hypothetical protein
MSTVAGILGADHCANAEQLITAEAKSSNDLFIIVIV